MKKSIYQVIFRILLTGLIIIAVLTTISAVTNINYTAFLEWSQLASQQQDQLYANKIVHLTEKASVLEAFQPEQSLTPEGV
ncbi:hypothetical protein SAMN04488134_111103 [Amphibacillus marinus]|uniref:Uncharacterized protein n=1 Tax=Amphibacillus marinus TaxID=872970 RepID=A0A1H8S198_9BACI|nr:hypothetical protein [Amphibacillus marinus]SEO71953.1 hypothetical protein SAMN04488134_111103 [Amphibacillus marinus]